MSNRIQCLDTLERYLKARIPFISVRTAERSRILEIFNEASERINIPIYVHTLSQGTRDIKTGRVVNEDRSVAGALDFINGQMLQRQNLTFIITEINDLEDDTPTARMFQDTVTLAAETGGSIIIITTKGVWGQLQRLGMAVTLDKPNEDEMVEIIDEAINPYRGQLNIEWRENEVKKAAAILQGLSRIEAENVLATILAKGSILNEDMKEVMNAKDKIFADISGIERIKVGDSLNVGGLDGLKRWLNHERPLLTADLRERGIRPPRGVLLVGVPGCGKSLSAKAIASDWQLPLYRLDLSTIHGQYLGQSEGRLKEALATADHVAPCVLWIDEIEKGLAGATAGNSDGGTSTRLVGQFLFWLQEATARVFVVATANDVSKLPPELLRRGRFDELFFVDLPTAEERREIIDIYVKRGLKSTIDANIMNELVEKSEGFAGSDIESAVREVVKEAYLNGDASVTDDLFIKAFENVVPLSKTSPEQIENIRAWGRERAVSASGRAIGVDNQNNIKARRSILV